MPFNGDFRGATWNMRSLFTRKANLQDTKWPWVSRIMAQHDFLAIQETHGTAGFVHTAVLPRDTRSWWAHASQQAGGIGIMVKKSFLSQFTAPTPQDWTILEEGRLARLRLKGPKGAIDLYIVYMATG